MTPLNSGRMHRSNQLSEFFEIAYAAASSKLCLFTGTGFSKAATANEAPSWQGLLESVCSSASDPVSLKSALFPEIGKNPLDLEEAAQVISIELTKIGKSIHQEVAAEIRKLTLKGDTLELVKFLAARTYKVITTNYDKLLESLAGDASCQSLTPGLPIPRSQSRVKIYHVHGSVDSPENMVVTSDDYFKFLNAESYFSRKLSTVLHENTVVIIGYSLGDTNLKAIISDYKGFSRNHVIGSNIFLVSRSVVAQHIKDYYSHCYGIRVLDQLEVTTFFQQLNAAMPEAERRLAGSIDNIRRVIFEKNTFTKDYLRIENTFFEIIFSLAAIGVSINDPRVVKTIGETISTKIQLTQENGAWVQYEHLARWLIYLASILELKGTSIEEVFLDATLTSMNAMARELRLGYSWHAYKSWASRWPGIIASNRLLIRSHIDAKTAWPDAIAVVSSA